ncbi:MAG: ribonucleoside-diphosphate reductase alpha chain, partial [Parcubacteria group bacterium Greene0714_36]
MGTLRVPRADAHGLGLPSSSLQKAVSQYFSDGNLLFFCRLGGTLLVILLFLEGGKFEMLRNKGFFGCFLVIFRTHCLVPSECTASPPLSYDFILPPFDKKVKVLEVIPRKIFDAGFDGRRMGMSSVTLTQELSFVRFCGDERAFLSPYLHLFMPKTLMSSSPVTMAAARPAAKAIKTRKIPLKRMFTKEGAHPFDQVGWKKVKITVRGSGMNSTVEERELEFPDFWSDNACNIAGSKYFRGRIGSPERESSARQMIDRVVRVISEWGVKFGHLDNDEDAAVFSDELRYILLHQRAAFNSPVWFNVGVIDKPQCSACFLLAVEDNMDSILDWIRTEGVIFKGGSGSGVNLSPLRSSGETLSAGGRSSGPVAFMRGADSVAGMIASGGSTRRAAKMVVMNIDHPDIMQFIRCKAEEEKKVHALMEAGYPMYDLNNAAWNSIQYQNANNSVRVTDEFMAAVENDEQWSTRQVTTGEVVREYRARDLMREIATAAWESGDPGIQYDTTINRWHTNPHTGRITTSNPCSEYLSIDNSACNLSSINLLRYLNADGSFDVRRFIHTVDVMIMAQEIIVDGSSYPTERIGKNAHDFRQLGLGYSNLGALLMAWGMPYDSDAARQTAGAITALMTGEAYRFSAEIARHRGPYDEYALNREPQLSVIAMHRDAVSHIRAAGVGDRAIRDAAVLAWDEAVILSRKYGVRNSQVTLLAPTGTISLMMDCATTGIEPEFALVKTKKLVGGGTMKFINTTVLQALEKLGYGSDERAAILAYIEDRGTIEGAPHLKDQHLAVFDCAVKPLHGQRVISWQGHVKMVAAAQPFLS